MTVITDQHTQKIRTAKIESIERRTLKIEYISVTAHCCCAISFRAISLSIGSADGRYFVRQYNLHIFSESCCWWSLGQDRNERQFRVTNPRRKSQIAERNERASYSYIICKRYDINQGFLGCHWRSSGAKKCCYL